MKTACFLLVLLLPPMVHSQGEAEKLRIVEVKKDDTLSKISKKYLEDPNQWPALLKYNQIANPNLIQPGLKLRVPASLGKKPSGVVVYKTGSAQFARAQESVWNEVSVKLSLYAEDQLKAGSASSVHLQLRNQTLLRLQPQSAITMDKVDKASRDVVLTLPEGSLQASVENMRKSGGRFSIRTPSAVAAVRGTVFELQASAQSSGLACYEGQVDVSAQKVTVEVPAGMGTYVEKGKTPQQPFRLPAPPVIRASAP